MKENKSNIKKGILVGSIVSVALLLGFLGSYAYFIGAGNNNQRESAKVETGNMALTFSDGSSSFQGSLEFGGSATKTFTIENTGSLEAKAKINWKNLKNTYLKGSLTYTLSYSETENGMYTEIVTNKQLPRSENPVSKTLANNITIPVGKTYYYKLVITLNYLEDIDQTADLNAILSTEFSLEETEEMIIIPEIVQAIVDKKEVPASSVKSGNPTFVNAATSDETTDGLYTMQDDYGTSYYFRGAVENNYVKFGGFYWRIIRINGDGSLRMVYDGEQAYENSTNDVGRLALTNVAYNTNYNDAKYVGYMYGPSGTDSSTSKSQAQTNTENSNIKTQVENWYKTNIRDKGLDEFVSDSIYCNDRTINSGSGYGTKLTYYGGYARLGAKSASIVNPQFTCSNKNDAFTKSDTTKGNGALSEKVGLITADEVVAAGSGKHGTTNSSYYLYKGQWYWSISSYYCYYGNSSVFRVNNTGDLGTYYVTTTLGVAPVISLTPEYASQMIGDGTIGNEYRLAEDSFS